MSIHCLICGGQANWRNREGRESDEVSVDDKTWIIMRLFRDNLLGENVKNQRNLEHYWVHRDCIASQLRSWGADTSIEYYPKIYPKGDKLGRN